MRTILARVAGFSNEQQVVLAARLTGVGELTASVAHKLSNTLGTITLRFASVLDRIPEHDTRRNALEVVDH